MHLEAAVISQVISRSSISGHKTSTQQRNSGHCGQLLSSKLSKCFPLYQPPLLSSSPSWTFSSILSLVFPNKSSFLNERGTLSHVMSYPLPFLPFCLRCDSFLCCTSPQFLCADKVRPKDVKHFPKAPDQYDVLFTFLCCTHS